MTERPGGAGGFDLGGSLARPCTALRPNPRFQPITHGPCESARPKLGVQLPASARAVPKTAKRGRFCHMGEFSNKWSKMPSGGRYIGRRLGARP